MPQFLISIEIQGQEKIWNRSLIVGSIPDLEDLKFYYNRLCGFETSAVELTSEIIPDEFNTALLTNMNTAPSQFPVSDLETEKNDCEKRQQYKQYIKQLCDMERTRSKLQVFVKKEDKGKEQMQEQIQEKEIKVRSQHKAWVQEILQTLNQDQDYENAIVTVNDDKETIIPLAWILTPTVIQIRESYGSRFILDQSLGKKWEDLIATDLYPDFVVSRRISTANWALQHENSVSFLKATLDWYLFSQDAVMVDGLSSWIYDADREINILLQSIRKIKINERHLKNTTESQTQVFKILSIIENQHLASSMEDDSIHPISSDLFLKFMNYVFQALNIPKEQYWGLESLRLIVQRWDRSLLGFRQGIDSYVEAWKLTWRVVMNDHVSRENLILFLNTLDTWDPIESLMVCNTQRMKLTRDWIHLYIETQLIKDENSVVRSPILQERVIAWCLQFLPKGLFEKNITPMAIGPVFTTNGFITKKGPTGRWTAGIKFKEDDAAIPKVFSQSLHPVTQDVKESEAVKPKKGRKKKEKTEAETETETEINLGTI